MNKERTGQELSDADYKPTSGHDLDSADADRRVMERNAQVDALKRIQAEPETPEEREIRLQNLRSLRDRYRSGNDSGPKAA